jgi:hypothetical protein
MVGYILGDFFYKLIWSPCIRLKVDKKQKIFFLNCFTIVKAVSLARAGIARYHLLTTYVYALKALTFSRID